MASDEGTSKGSVIGDQQSPYHYGTFQGVANYYPPPPTAPPTQPLQPVPGYPQPIAPPCVSAGGVAVDVDSRWNPYCRRNEFGCSPQAQYYALGYQTVPGYVLVEGRPPREPPLPCCGLGIGWILFITGFFLGAIPWYLGTFILLCVRVDYREKPGYVACSIAATLAFIAITFGLTQGGQNWRDWDMPNWNHW